jgi:branched-chain amino acid transport system ATP-binding protein
MPASDRALLKLVDVHKNFGGVSAVDGVSLQIAPGSIAGLIGPNGAGKTTVINLITGQLTPDGGDILLDGVAIGGRRPDQIAAQGVARTFQNIRLYRGLTVVDNVIAGMHVHRARAGLAHLLPARRARPADAARLDEAHRLLSLVGLDPVKSGGRLGGTLSYGDQRRLEIARALALRPRLLLLDEPAAGMNPDEKDQMRSLLQRLRTEGLTTLLIDHDTRLVLGVCHDVTVLNFGRRIAGGPPAQIASDPEVITAYLGTGRTGATTVPTGPAPIGPAPISTASTGPAVTRPAPPGGPGRAAPARSKRIGGPPQPGTDRPDQRQAPGEPLLSVEHLAVNYGVIEAVTDVSLEVAEGEIVALIGANGAGKSTILNTLSGLLRVRNGQARFGSLDLASAKPQAIVRAGLVQVPEGREILTRLSVEENLLLGGWTRNRAAAERAVAEMMAKFPILEQRRRLSAGQLSGGEQQLLAIARALIAQPRLLLLDEPSLGLAPQLAEEVFTLIEAIRGQGITVLLVEQNARRALELADRAYVIETGRVVLSGTGAELQHHPQVQQAYLGTA